MLLLLSGEGETDLGRPKYGCENKICSIARWQVGPLVYLIDEEYKIHFRSSAIEKKHIFFLSRKLLGSLVKGLPSNLSQGYGTHFFTRKSRALLAAALFIQNKMDSLVMPILFTDADGTRSTPKLHYEQIRDSIKKPLKNHDIYTCPLVPNPKSEAWILCALKENYQNCQKLESISGSKMLKSQLKDILGKDVTRENLVQCVLNGQIDYSRINMPSIKCFRDDFSDTKQQVFTLKIPDNINKSLLKNIPQDILLD